jgi:hypothetical protein
MQPSADVLHTNRHLSYRPGAVQQLPAPDAALLRFAAQVKHTVERALV